MAIDPATPLLTASAHIDVSPGTCGGKPRIAGHRIRVQDVVIWVERLGQSADEIVSRHPQLTLADVYAALAFYHDHRDEIDAQMQQDDKLIEEVRRLYPSKVQRKLSANG